LAALSLFSCKKGGIKGIKVDNFSNGKAGEVILVLDQKYASEETLNYIKEVLTQPQPALNQIEPMFNLLHFENKDFTSHFQRHRNIIQFDINPNYASNTFGIETNVWSSPQIHIYFRGNDMNSLMLFFIENENDIIKALYDNDLKRIQYYASSNNDPFIEKKIKEKFDIRITIPGTYDVAREEDDFMWLRFKTVRNDRFIIIYKTRGNDLSKQGLINARNEITKAYIPGAIKDAYPVVAEVQPFPLYKDNVTVGAITGAELRGLWECVGDKMGGPFYNFSVLDKTNENVISVDGFVYAPEEEKRDYLREVEAIVKSVK
jgi:hypothetical protein